MEAGQEEAGQERKVVNGRGGKEGWGSGEGGATLGGTKDCNGSVTIVSGREGEGGGIWDGIGQGGG